MFRTTLLVAVLLLSVSMASAQDAARNKSDPGVPANDQGKVDVAQVIEQALAAYRAADYQKSVTLLQQAIGQIQKMSEQGWGRFFPTVAGWEGGKIDSQSSSTGTGNEGFQMTQLRRSYREIDGERTVEVTITNSPQLVASSKASLEMYKNPQLVALMKQDPNRSFDVIDTDGWTGIVTVEKKDGGHVMALCGSTLVTINLNGANAELVRKFWDAMDHKAMAAVAKR